MESITVTELKEKILDANPVNIVDVRTDQKQRWVSFQVLKPFQ